MSFVALLQLAVTLAGAHLPGESLDAIALDVAEVVATEQPLFRDDYDADARRRTGELLMVWSYRESTWRADAIGDHGWSLGAMQTNKRWLGGLPEADVLSDRRLGLRLGLRVMIHLRDRCGSVASGLHAYATGRCGSPGEKTRARCALIGGCEDRRR